MELLRAAEGGNMRTLRLMLERGADVNYKDPSDGRTALHLAAKYGRLPEVKLLVEAFHAKHLLRDENYNLPVTLAAAAGQTHVVSYFVESGLTDVNSWSSHWGLLHIAAFEGRWSTVRWLLQNGCDPLAPGMHGRLPLHRAAYTDTPGAIACVKMLLDWGIDVNVPDDSGWTALHSAAEQGNFGVVQVLLDRGASLQEFDVCSGGDTPLMLAAANGHLNVVQALLRALDSESDLRTVLGTRNAHEQTVMHRAAANGHLQVVEYLMGCPGAAELLSLPDSSGCTARDLAADLHDAAMVLTLEGEPWSPARHDDYPFNFKVAVRCVLVAALGRDRAAREAQSAKNEGGHGQESASAENARPGAEDEPEPAGLWSLPAGVLRHVISLMAFPLSGWKGEGGYGGSEQGQGDSPADIIADNLWNMPRGSLPRRLQDPLPAPSLPDWPSSSRGTNSPWMRMRDEAAAVRSSNIGGAGSRDMPSYEQDTASPADIIWDNTLRLHHTADAKAPGTRTR